MIELRVRSQISADELESKVGKVLGPRDFNAVLTGPAKVLKPDGNVLCVYLPGILRPALSRPGVYDVLHSLHTVTTENRGAAAGAPREVREGQTWSRARKVSSAILGSMDPSGGFHYCRQTAWTGRHIPEFARLRPVLSAVDRAFAEHVPNRYAAQRSEAARTDPAWIIPGTVFTTITVNNSYPTGVHTDAGDLDEGFSTLTTLRRGRYRGGELVFPKYRIAVDMHDGDLLLMDAHTHHGNTFLRCAHGDLNGPCPKEGCEAERVSLVSYFRTKMVSCGTPDVETRKAMSAGRHAKAAQAAQGPPIEPEGADATPAVVSDALGDSGG